MGRKPLGRRAFRVEVRGLVFHAAGMAQGDAKMAAMKAARKAGCRNLTLGEFRVLRDQERDAWAAAEPTGLAFTPEELAGLPPRDPGRPPGAPDPEGESQTGGDHP